MEMLTNELRTSTRERANFVGQVQDETHKLLADVQPFLRALAQEHKAMAEHLRDVLATNRQENCASVNTLRQKFRDEMQGMRESLQELLKLTREQRQQELAETRIEFRATRETVANDLRNAAQVWRQRSHTRASRPGLSHAGAKGKNRMPNSLHVENVHLQSTEPKSEQARSAVPEPAKEHVRAAVAEPKTAHQGSKSKSHKSHR